MNNRYRLGDWKVICDTCGFEKYASECRMTWDNYFVCADTCWEPKHPQLSVRGVKDDQSVPISRPEGEPRYLDTNEVTQDDL